MIMIMIMMVMMVMMVMMMMMMMMMMIYSCSFCRVPSSLMPPPLLGAEAQIYSKNPNVKCVNFRGNVQTRHGRVVLGGPGVVEDEDNSKVEDLVT